MLGFSIFHDAMNRSYGVASTTRFRNALLMALPSPSRPYGVTTTTRVRNALLMALPSPSRPYGVTTSSWVRNALFDGTAVTEQALWCNDYYLGL